MVRPEFLRLFAVGVLLWACFYLAVTWIVDPYGVSPVRISLERVNKFKPKRQNIDRPLKPFEVWRYQPQTIFLGTSRTQQSVDPAVLDGTRFAPAYNASIPASTLSLNVSHLRQYVDLDSRLRTVVVELFFYNFLEPIKEPARSPETLAAALRNAAPLFISADALWDSALTLGFNLFRNVPHYEIKPGGNFYYPPGHDASGPFGGYAAGIWTYHEQRAGGIRFHEPAFDAVNQMITIAEKRNLELVFWLTPNHAYDDFYLEMVGGWDAVAQWLTRISARATVYSFSQPNSWVYEPVRRNMRYWNDPYHYSLVMGAAMQKAMAGGNVDGMPANFMMRMTPDKVTDYIALRRQAVARWAEANPEFVAKFKAERRKWENDYAMRRKERRG